MAGSSRGRATFAILTLFSIVLCIPPAWAQVEPALPTGGLKEADEGLQRKITLDADDAFLPSILSILAEKSGYNIVTGPGVNKEERISIHLKDTPIEQAMNLVVRAAGLSYELVGHSFLVAPAEKLKAQVGLSSYVVELQYTDAATLKQVLSEFNARITVDTTGNKLLIITSPKIISDILKVIEEVDKPALQIVLEVRIIEVAVEDEQKLGIDWNRLATIQTVLSEGPVDEYGNFVTGDLTKTLSGLDASAQGRVPTQLPYFPLETRRLGYLTKQASAFEVALDWLLKQNRAEVLANSAVATMNNRAAELQVIDEVPYIARAGGLGGQVMIDKVQVGVKLTVRPKVNTDGYITTEISPELSSIFQFIESAETKVPWVKRRMSTTTIRVKDGETIIIAGLLGTNASKTVHKVPFLGDIPFIGGLFRHTAEQTSKTDLIIQVTPHILGRGYALQKPKRVQEAEQKYLPGAVPEEEKPQIHEEK
ncbi:MAG: secretin and TonB N-terminal domain-containing protein [bacterium]